MKNLFSELTKDNAAGLAAQQAFYYLLSIFPLLILFLSLLPYFNIDADRAVSLLYQFVPAETASLFQETIEDTINSSSNGLLTIGIIGTIWTASLGLNAFIRAMNGAYDVLETRPFFIVRLISVGLTFGLMLSVIIALFLPVFGSLILSAIQSFIYVPEDTVFLVQLLRWIVTISVTSVILATLYHLAPNNNMPFWTVLPGAMTATLLWQIISLGFSFYVNNFANYASTYGSLGGVIVLMIWLFLVGMLLVIGGEINALVYRRRQKKHPAPLLHDYY
ncbi:YihY/virulence factor BrkB family protein [Marinococcus halophilus]|uniref:Putative ribonuclease-like protein YfkH n=1 Tax=Marinococcus halophilus TaxID=1371 RepID=A0A510Y1K8_MARHA|nr:YihY/virulence factor BrkB family protein [Marinococcus halophilus]GEK57198.1 putative ribonuclease-like protein YfkH [Marinococcus halophilus]